MAAEAGRNRSRGRRGAPTAGPFQTRFGHHFLVVAAFALLGGVTSTRAQMVVRDLPDAVMPGQTFTVSIGITPPGGTAVAGLEDRPPSTWVVSNISHSGSFDPGSMSVKWGPFFDPSIPASVFYDVTAPSNLSGTNCFVGTASFDGNDVIVAGDLCLPPPVPAASAWALLTLALLIVVTGAVRLRRGGRRPAGLSDLV